MSETLPERIWAFHVRASGIELGEWVEDPSDTASGTEYVRADLIEALERENAALRDNDAKMQLLHQQEDQLIAAERKVAELEAKVDAEQNLCRRWQEKADALDLARAATEADKARLSEALRQVRHAIMNADPAVLTDTFWMPDNVFKGGTVVDFIDAALSGSGSGWPVPAGWKLVPVELTQSMIIAYNEEFEKLSIEKWANALLTWPALLAASPAAPQQGGE